MRLLDLFCGAGGAAVGYQRAGFDEIVGIDMEPQPNYPFAFVQADALKFHLDGLDLIHASPPCQKYSRLNPVTKKKYPDLIRAVRRRIKAYTYVIENVPGSPLDNPLMLCGTMFGLRVLRHRLFEIPRWHFDVIDPLHCDHKGRTQKNSRDRGKGAPTPSLATCKYLTITGADYIAEDGRAAMGIGWMTKKELSQAIPPAYTEYIGRTLIELISRKGGQP